jgi:hypothetical protein
MTLPDLPPSVFNVPAVVSEYDIERAIREKISSPMVHGILPEISASLNADSTSLGDVAKDEVHQLAPAQVISTTKTETQAIRKSVSTAVNPLKWRHHAKDIAAPVQVPVQAAIAVGAPVVKWTVAAGAKLVEKFYNVAAWVNYDIYLKDLSLKFSGNSITISVSTRTHLKFDFRDPTVSFGPNIVIKGLLNFDVDNDFTLSGSVNVNDSLGLDVALDDDQTAFAFTSSQPFALKGIDVVTYMNPTWFAYKKALQAVIKSAVNNAICKKIDDSEGDLQFKDRILNAVDKINNPWMIAQNLWIIPNVQRGSISNWDTYEKDNTSYLRVSVGLIAKPTFEYSIDTPAASQITVLLTKSEVISPGVKARFQLGLDYASAGKTLTDSLKDYVDRVRKKIPFTTGQVILYPSGERLAVAVDITRTGGGKLGTVYLWGCPRFDTLKKSFVIDSLDYYLATKNVVLRTIDDILAGEILSYIRKHSEWSADSVLASAKRRLNPFFYATEYGDFTGSLTALPLSKVFTDTDQLKVFADLNGTLNFKILPLEFLSAKPSPNTGLNQKLVSKIGANPISTDIHHVGDTANVVIKDSVYKELVTFKNKSLPGDTIFYKIPDGSVSYYIVSKSDLQTKNVVMDFGTF